MKLPEHIRVATKEDAAAMLEIYTPIVTDTVISFEYEVPSLEEFTGRVENTLHTYPWLVYEENGKILGYAYATGHRNRVAYQWTTELSIYLHPQARGKGIGTALYLPLIAIVKAQGFQTALAGITQPNAASVGFHEALGFTHLGTYENVGFKAGQWQKVGWWQKAIGDGAAPEKAPVPFRDFVLQQQD